MARPANRSQLFLRYWLPALVYIAAIVFLSAQPRLKPPLDFQNADKWYHVIEYSGLGIVMVRAMRATLGFEKILPAGLLTLAVGTVIAISDELFQSTIPGRMSSHLDVMADVSGIVCALLVYMWFAKE